MTKIDRSTDCTHKYNKSEPSINRGWSHVLRKSNCSGADMWIRCALPEESMKLCPRGYLSMLISKIAGTTTSFQRFPLKNEKFKMAAANQIFANNSPPLNPITMILVSLPMCLGSRDLIKALLSISDHYQVSRLKKSVKYPRWPPNIQMLPYLGFR